MSLVTASIHIPAKPLQVWETVMDPACLGEWVTIHRKLIHADDGPARVGYAMDQEVHMRGVSLAVHWKLVECRAGELAVWRAAAPPVPMHAANTPSPPRAKARILTTATSFVRHSVQSAR